MSWVRYRSLLTRENRHLSAQIKHGHCTDRHLTWDSRIRLTRENMNKYFTFESDLAVSRLRSVARTGSLSAVIGELTTMCKEITADQCSALARLVPRLSIETARISVRIDQ